MQLEITFLDGQKFYYPILSSGGWGARTDPELGEVLVILTQREPTEIPMRDILRYCWTGLMPPDPTGVQAVVEWAEREAQGGPVSGCPASVTQRGYRWGCNLARGHHPAEGHVSRSGELVWFGAPADEVS